ncbi:hypothetical protein BS643_22670 [Pseudomonas protegens]|uniref:hypothetical protein n=1 Tax=Pseudomonas protegens TaxID=380021 RepID=UPI00093A885F|nr:hypothetical protein [Pseudomonas protegens]OKK40552.1 hypothetical protein BS643_22670 [Pseudomonas protegens]OKK52854.1 hypothetical protein BS644_03195 [Pseudomonas protegens]OKK58346.1 hypothetical protein BS646_24810 [Pseudomonas protegens]OKK59624.1 hypothetical protein BS645_17160 [Pseudomonas protegens]
MNDQTKRCACPGCSIPIDPQQPFEGDAKAYCCAACADHHPHGEPCPHLDCHCEDGALEENAVLGEPSSG